MRAGLFKILIPALLASGCAHYQLPSSQLESSETIGKGRGEVMLLELLSGTDLNSEPGMTSPDPESGDSPEARAPASFAKPALSFRYGVQERVELGIRLQTYGPISLLGRWQLSGKPASTAKRGDFSTSISTRAGLLVTGLGEESTSLLAAGAALTAGYRLGATHLLTLGPFLSLASLSNSPVVSSVGGAAEAASYSALQYGGALGYQREMMDLVLRAELSYAMGTRDQIKIRRIAAAAAAGLRF